MKFALGRVEVTRNKPVLDWLTPRYLGCGAQVVEEVEEGHCSSINRLTASSTCCWMRWASVPIMHGNDSWRFPRTLDLLSVPLPPLAILTLPRPPPVTATDESAGWGEDMLKLGMCRFKLQVVKTD